MDSCGHFTYIIITYPFLMWPNVNSLMATNLLTSSCPRSNEWPYSKKHLLFTAYVYIFFIWSTNLLSLKAVSLSNKVLFFIVVWYKEYGYILYYSMLSILDLDERTMRSKSNSFIQISTYKIRNLPINIFQAPINFSCLLVHTHAKIQNNAKIVYWRQFSNKDNSILITS